MGKIIIVSFAFMAFAFYELSGGESFVPLAEEKRAKIAQLQAEQDAIKLAEKEKREAEREKRLLAAAATPAVQTQVIQASQITNAEPATDPLANVITAALEADKAEEIIAEASLEEAPAAIDTREVTSARVNMRNGPGRNFSVVSKLSAGDRVEILQDPGDGWVKLKVVENGRIGWMADFLLTAANN